jgi:hypothetical protein
MLRSTKRSQQLRVGIKVWQATNYRLGTIASRASGVSAEQFVTTKLELLKHSVAARPGSIYGLKPHRIRGFWGASSSP